MKVQKYFTKWKLLFMWELLCLYTQNYGYLSLYYLYRLPSNRLHVFCQHFILLTPSKLIKWYTWQQSNRNVVAKMMENSRCACPTPDNPDDMHLGRCAKRTEIPILHSNRMFQARPPDYPVSMLSSRLELQRRFYKNLWGGWVTSPTLKQLATQHNVN